jgi:hypothetical protein
MGMSSHLLGMLSRRLHTARLIVKSWQRIPGFLIAMVPPALWVLDQWRNENPNGWQPPYAADIYGWLPQWAWLCLFLGALLVITFEYAVSRTFPLGRVPANRSDLIKAIMDLKEAGLEVVETHRRAGDDWKRNSSGGLQVPNLSPRMSKVNQVFQDSQKDFRLQTAIAGEGFDMELSLYRDRIYVIAVHFGYLATMQLLPDGDYIEAQETIQGKTKEVLVRLDAGELWITQR